MGTGLAILAAVLFAFGTVLQQKGTMATEDDDSRFLLLALFGVAAGWGCVWIARLLIAHRANFGCCIFGGPFDLVDRRLELRVSN